MSGWICLHRQIVSSAVFADPDLLRLWVWILARANWEVQHVTMKTGRGNTIVTLQPGQFITGRMAASEELEWSPSTFRRRLKRLEAMGMIALKVDTHWSVVSVVNWEKYQQPNNDKWTGSGQAITPESGQATDRQTTRQIAAKERSGFSESLKSGQANSPNVDRQRTGNGHSRTIKTIKNKGERTRPILQDLQAFAGTLDPSKYQNAIGCVEAFHDFYAANGWQVGRNPMKDWRAAFRNWVRRQREFTPGDSGQENLPAAKQPKRWNRQPQDNPQ